MQVKPLDAFYVNQYSPDGRYSFCKVCFDLLIKKDKQTQNPISEFEKKCEKCHQVKLLNEFYETPKSLPGKESWCKSCQQVYLESLKPIEKSKYQPAQDRALALTEAPEAENFYDQEDYKQLSEEWGLFLELDVEDIRGLLEHSLEESLQPKPRISVMVKERRCNGCGRLEQDIEAGQQVMLPVHAWFCDVCRANKTRMYVRKGFTVYDRYGRAYKIKKVINDELVEGVMLKEDGRCEKKRVRIYGNWTTRK